MTYCIRSGTQIGSAPPGGILSCVYYIILTSVAIKHETTKQNKQFKKIIKKKVDKLAWLNCEAQNDVFESVKNTDEQNWKHEKSEIIAPGFCVVAESSSSSSSSSAPVTAHQEAAEKPVTSEETSSFKQLKTSVRKKIDHFFFPCTIK